MKLANKIALITGAGSGMGRAASLLFAKEGARIACADIDEKGAQETAHMIEADGGEAFAVKSDVSKSANAEAMVAATLEKFGAPLQQRRDRGSKRLSRIVERRGLRPRN